MKKWLIIGAGAIAVLVVTFVFVNKVSPVGWGMWGETNSSDGVALSGYDPVSYFDNNKPTAGSSEFSQDWGGVTWQFSNSENRDLFVSRPEDYAPQFGGFCTFAVSKGFTADISADAWHLEDGKLYLFADQNVRDEWVAGLSEGSLVQSSENWSKR